MKKLIFLFSVFMSMVGTKALAFDIEVKNADGVTIYYDYINDGKELEVESFGSNCYEGDVIIPEEVIYDEKTMKVTSIGIGAFDNCYYLTSVTIPNTVNTIKRSAFSKSINLTSVSLGNSVTSIGERAFSACSSLTSIIIPNSVTSIEKSTFMGCSSLTSITIPNSVTSIGEEAFRGCSSLTSVIIGEGIVLIDYHAFEDCKLLTDVYCFAKEVPRTDNNTFSGCFLDYATLHIPANSIELYKAKKPWNKFKNIVALGSDSPDNPTGEKCATPTISYQNGKLVFSCSTEGAICFSTITDVDVTSFMGNEINLYVTYNINVYATKAGYENSETATATLCWIDVEPRTEGITNDVASVRAMPVMIQNDGGMLAINGVEDNTSIAVYDLNGIQVGSAISNNGVAYVNTNLSRDSIAIVKIGNKSVKVIVR